jgi:GNAT superfamily N-acetyltransferase
MTKPARCYTYSFADDKGEYTAHLHIYERSGTLWLTDVWVKADERGKGLARAMIEAALEDWGRQTLYLEVAPYADRPKSAADLRAFYERYGFVATDVPTVMRRYPV